MTRSTFQGRLRTTGGRPLSAINRSTGLPMNMLRQNLAGPIQIVTTDLGGGTVTAGLLPKNWVITGWGVITPAGAGTFRLDLPAYDGLGAVNLVAALTAANAATAEAATAVGVYAGPYTKDRPVTITGVGVTGDFRVGLFGFPLDDGTDEYN